MEILKTLENQADSLPDRDFHSDAANFLLTVGSVLLTVELFYLQLTILTFLLAIGAFCLQL